MRESFLHQKLFNQKKNSNNTKVIKLTKIEIEKLTSIVILPLASLIYIEHLI